MIRAIMNRKNRTVIRASLIILDLHGSCDIFPIILYFYCGHKGSNDGRSENKSLGRPLNAVVFALEEYYIIRYRSKRTKELLK